VLTLDRLAEVLSALPGRTIGLVGDLFIHRYLELVPGAFELSIETGLEAYQVQGVRNSPGALGTVMNNLAALGVGRLVPVTVIGDDGHGYDLVHALGRLPVDTAHVLRIANRLTPTYTKPMRASHDGASVELNRLDVRTRGPLDAAAQARLDTAIAEVFFATDGLIVLDQIHEPNAGVVNEGTRAVLAELARQYPDKLMFIDSRAFIGEFSFGTLKPNRSECLAATGESDAGRAAAKLARRTGQNAFCTLGAEGLLVVAPDGAPAHVSAIPVRGPIDVVGAGDSATAGIVAALLCGASAIEAAEMGNLVASITIQQLGTTGVATPAQVVARWHEARVTMAACT
jgi:bifunctional ADP-heptose synthase (sugar kinase/adenylyltransferase)